MKNKIQRSVLAMVVAVLGVSVAQAADEELQSDSQLAVANFQKADPTMTKFFTDSAGYAVFPDVGKGGLVVGGAHGKGLVYEKGKVIGKASMTQASIGAQAGGQTFAQIIFFQTPDALQNFKSGNYEMSAEVSAIAAKQGASSAADYKQGVAVFTLPKKGLMAQASVGGQKFSFEPTTTEPTGR